MTWTREERRETRERRGLSLVEVIVALSILGGVLLALGMFSARLSQGTSSSRIRIAAAQLAADRLEQVKSAPRYTVIESLYVATESSIPGNPGFSRQTWVQRVGGAVILLEQRVRRRLGHVARGVEVRLTDLEMDDVAAGCLECAGARCCLEGGLGADPLHAAGQFHSQGASCGWIATLGAPSVPMPPPNVPLPHRAARLLYFPERNPAPDAHVRLNQETDTQ